MNTTVLKTLLISGLVASSSVYASSIGNIISNYNIKEEPLELEKHSSLIREVRFKLDLENNQTDYDEPSSGISARFYLNGFNEYKSKKNLFHNQNARLKLLNQEHKNEELELLYQNIINISFSNQMIKEYRKLMTTYQDKINVFKVLIKKGRADILDLVATQKKYNDTITKKSLAENERAKNLKLLSAMVGGKRKLSEFSRSNGFVSYKIIENLIDKKSSFQSNSLKLAELNRVKENLEWDLETSASKKILEYVELGVKQADFSSDSGKDDEKKIGVTFAFNIPGLKDSSMQTNEKLLKKVNAEYEARMARKQSLSEFDSLTTSLKGTIISLKAFDKSNLLSDIQKYLKAYSKRRGTEPLKLLSLNESLSEGRLRRMELESNMLKQYIQLLKENGTLARFDKVNVLSKNFLKNNIGEV